jgi:NADH:ubiquinone oxidoreductase subunit E
MVPSNKGTSPGNSRAGLLPALKGAVGKNGSLNREAMSGLAGQCRLPLNEVFGVATFYAFLPVSPAGKNIIRVCRCLPCHLKDAQAVIGSIKNELGIVPGETSSDGKFSFELVGCIGACDQAPAMMINDKVYGNLTPAGIAEILKSYG